MRLEILKGGGRETKTSARAILFAQICGQRVVSKDHLVPLLQRSVAGPHNFSHPQSKRNEVRKSRNNVPFIV